MIVLPTHQGRTSPDAKTVSKIITPMDPPEPTELTAAGPVAAPPPHPPPWRLLRARQHVLAETRGLAATGVDVTPAPQAIAVIHRCVGVLAYIVRPLLLPLRIPPAARSSLPWDTARHAGAARLRS
jgi:hypothetical protein